MEAVDPELQAAQEALIRKRAALSSRTDPTRIGSDEPAAEQSVECRKCRKMVPFTPTGPLDFRKSRLCDECDEKERLEEEAREAALRERIRIERIDQRMRDCGLGVRFMGIGWADYEPVSDDSAQVKAKAMEYVDTFDPSACRNITFIGSPGTGKNMMASIIGQELIRKGFNFQYTTALRIVRRIKDSWRDKEETESGVLVLYQKPDLLCIDEVGVQFGSATEQMYLTEVINNRYEAMKPTLLISNLTMNQLIEVMGARAVDRMYDNESLFLVFNWESYRRRGK